MLLFFLTCSVWRQWWSKEQNRLLITVILSLFAPSSSFKWCFLREVTTARWASITAMKVLGFRCVYSCNGMGIKMTSFLRVAFLCVVIFNSLYFLIWICIWSCVVDFKVHDENYWCYQLLLSSKWFFLLLVEHVLGCAFAKFIAVFDWQTVR